jgi:hypothetical protein
VVESPSRLLPNGTEGKVIEVVEGCGIFFEAEGMPEPLSRGIFGGGWALTEDEVEVLDV